MRRLIWIFAGRKSTKRHVRPGKTQINLGILPVWSVFAVRMKKAWVLIYPLSAQRRLIKLGGCPGWSESSLVAFAILLVLSCVDSNILLIPLCLLIIDGCYCWMRATSVFGNQQKLLNRIITDKPIWSGKDQGSIKQSTRESFSETILHFWTVIVNPVLCDLKLESSR